MALPTCLDSVALLDLEALLQISETKLGRLIQTSLDNKDDPRIFLRADYKAGTSAVPVALMVSGFGCGVMLPLKDITSVSCIDITAIAQIVAVKPGFVFKFDAARPPAPGYVVKERVSNALYMWSAMNYDPTIAGWVCIHSNDRSKIGRSVNTIRQDDQIPVCLSTEVLPRNAQHLAKAA